MIVVGQRLRLPGPDPRMRAAPTRSIPIQSVSPGRDVAHRRARAAAMFSRSGGATSDVHARATRPAATGLWRTARQGGPLSALKYSLDDVLKPVVYRAPGIEISTKLTGDITLQQEGTVVVLEYVGDGKTAATVKGKNGEAVFSSDGETTAKINQTYKSKLVELGSGVEAKYNPFKKEASVSCKFSVASKVNGKVFATTDVSFIPPNKLKFKYLPAPVSGKEGDFVFEGQVGFEMEITPDNSSNFPVVTYVYVGAAAVAAAGVIIIVADIAKDFFFPPGAAESPLSWAAAMACSPAQRRWLGPQAARRPSRIEGGNVHQDHLVALRGPGRLGGGAFRQPRLCGIWPVRGCVGRESCFVWAGVAKALALALYAAYVLRNRTVRRLSVSIAIVMLAFGLWEATALRSNWSFRDAIEGDYVARLALSGVVFVVLGALEMARTRLTRP